MNLDQARERLLHYLNQLGKSSANALYPFHASAELETRLLGDPSGRFAQTLAGGSYIWGIRLPTGANALGRLSVSPVAANGKLLQFGGMCTSGKEQF